MKILITVIALILTLNATCQLRLGAGAGYHNSVVGQLIAGYNINGVELQTGFTTGTFKKRMDIPVTIGPVLETTTLQIRPYAGASYKYLGKSLDRYKGATLTPGNDSRWLFTAGTQVMRGNYYLDMSYRGGWMVCVGMSGIFGNQ